MLHFVKTVIRSLLEYACPVWHNSLTYEQSDRIESIQKRALKIKCGLNIIDYEQVRFWYNLPSLTERHETLCKQLFEKSVLRSTVVVYIIYCRRVETLI
jgi:hypothetical protein